MDRLATETNRLRLRDSPCSRRQRRFSDTARDVSALDLLKNANAAMAYASPWFHDDGPPALDQAQPSPSDEPHQCNSSVCSVTKVFGTPELLDIIMCYLDTKTVMELRRTSRIWANAVHDAPILRRHLFLRPQYLRPAADFLLLGPKLPGLTIEKGEPVEMGHWIQVSMSLSAARTILPTGRSLRRPRARSIYEGLRGGLGSRTQQDSNAQPMFETPHSANAIPYEALHVCQPPIMGMQAFFEVKTKGKAEDADDSDKISLSNAHVKLSCEAGITLDFLADLTLSLIDSIEEEDGKVIFKAIVSFCEPAPCSRKRRLDRSVIRIG